MQGKGWPFGHPLRLVVALVRSFFSASRRLHGLPAGYPFSVPVQAFHNLLLMDNALNPI